MSPKDVQTAVIPLAADFPAAQHEAWAALTARPLKGASPDSLTRFTAEGLAIAPLYEDSDAPPVPAKIISDWDIRTIVRHFDPAKANGELLQDLAQGSASVLIRLDPSGRDGVAAGTPEDLAKVLDGALIDVAPVALDAGFLGARAADWLASAAKGAPAARLALHMDPLSAFAQSGSSPGPIEAHLVACANTGARLSEPYPKATLFLASGRAVHEAGGGEALELAVAISAAIAYAKALTRAGLTSADAFARMALGLAMDCDYFLSIAKLRAARILWAKAAGLCGSQAPARIEAASSGRMLTRADPWTNMIRLTAACFAGAVGGADSVVLGAFTDSLGAPTPFARRQARNTQLVLMHEAHLGHVRDPAAGCGYLETLTDELARAAWERLQQIEAAGGMIAALEAGEIQRQTDEARAVLRERLAKRELKILGVTDFKVDDGRAVETAPDRAHGADSPDPRLPGPDSHCTALKPIRLEDLA
jgi:methylmalonyl-CoA mutase